MGERRSLSAVGKARACCSHYIAPYFGPACFAVGIAFAACFRRMPLSRSDRGPEPKLSTGPRLAAKLTLVP